MKKKIIITLVLIQVFCLYAEAQVQEWNLNNKVLLEASFNVDTATVGDTTINSFETINLNISHNPIGKAEFYFYSVPIEHDILKNSGISSKKDIRIKALYPCGIYLHSKIPIYVNGLLLIKKSDKETFFDTMAMNGDSIKQLKKIDKDIAIKKYGKRCKDGVLLIVTK